MRILVWLAMWCLASVSSPLLANWQQWPVVGSATLTWGFWTVYESHLRSPSGSYQTDRDLALEINYLRDLSSRQLLKATDQQWKKLGYSATRRQSWLDSLDEVWPDVKKGDTLTFVKQPDGQSQFWFDNSVIAEFTDPDLSAAFIAIWLSPQTSYPRLRRQLIGQASRLQ
ncbi:chalcone isomerase family protein [Thaumasiovibrio sp. DFM-14]|uniref:chalcone isomerase family protein n=1 Tax=Thaumasiovibrio sp. DFM-14 TaxID=3384792 RepID=UPI0039A3BFAF